MNELIEQIKDFLENKCTKEELRDFQEKLLKAIPGLEKYICMSASDVIENFSIDDIIEEIPYYEREYYLKDYIRNMNTDSILQVIDTVEFNPNDDDQQNIALNKCATSISRWYTLEELKANLCEYVDRNFYNIKSTR